MAPINLQLIKEPGFSGPSPIHIRTSLVQRETDSMMLIVWLSREGWLLGLIVGNRDIKETQENSSRAPNHSFIIPFAIQYFW